MKFSLNTDQSPFCIIGPFSFTIGQEEHDIDIASIPDDYKKQLLYNVNRKVLLTKDSNGLAALAKAMQPVTPVPAQQVPIKYQEVSKLANSNAKNPMQMDLKPLRSLLRQTVATVKKEAATYSPSQLRKLLELEKETKNRKLVTSFIEERLSKHQQAVAARVGEPDGDDDYKLYDPLATDPMRSTQITDVVESEEVQVVFRQGNLQDAGDGDLLLSQEVLSQIEEE